MLKSPTPLFQSSSHKTTSSITFSWLLHLRWGAIASQLLLIGILGIFFKVDIPLVIVGAILTFEIVTNLFFFNQKRQHKIISEWLFSAIMFIDVVLLTILLARTGGAMNPFTFLYLLHVVIGAVLMDPLPAWSLGFFTIACYTSFFLPDNFFPFSTALFSPAVIDKPVCLDVVDLANTTNIEMKLHLQGMLVAFAITTFFVIFFIGKIRNSLDSYHETVDQLKSEKSKSEKLAALATLSAGAAHELSTPLGTIDVATGEMLYFCKSHPVAEELLEDIHLVKGQVQVCKEILDQLSADSGTHRGEALCQFSISDLIAKLTSLFPEGLFTLISISPETADLQIYAPLRTFIRMLKGIIKNSIDATMPNQDPDISLCFAQKENYLEIIIVDQGMGMDKQTTQQATEPFFTTKDPGKGMGLGLFLARSITERFSGQLIIESKKDMGTNVTIRIALTQITRQEA